MTTLPAYFQAQGFLILLNWVLASYAAPNVYIGKELMLYFKMRCNSRCKYGYETDVEGRPLCKCYDPCKNIYCLGGSKCVIERPKSCPWESCRPNATCKVRRGVPGLRGEDKGAPPPLYGVPQADDRAAASSSSSSSSVSTSTSTSTQQRSTAAKGMCLVPVAEEDKNCKRLRKRWRFDPDSGKCVKFRGCKAGGNNFGRKKRCKRKCMKRSNKSRQKGGRRSRGSSRRSKQ